MSEARDWEWLRHGAAAYMVMDDYLSLPEDLARTIEVSDGLIVHCESLSENHLGIQQNLVMALQDAIEKFDREAGGCHRVRMELDLLLEQGAAFTFRRPDVTVYRCLSETPHSAARGGRKPTAADAEIVVEIVSEHSTGTDLPVKISWETLDRGL